MAELAWDSSRDHRNWARERDRQCDDPGAAAHRREATLHSVCGVLCLVVGVALFGGMLLMIIQG